MEPERRVAVYWDLENVVLSQYDFWHGRSAWARRSDLEPVELEDRLGQAHVDLKPVVDFAATLGVTTINRAYGDWSAPHLRRYAPDLLRHAVDLVQLFPVAGSKNGADIRLAIDVVEDLQSHAHVTDVLLVTGDSDFVSLVQRCRRHGRRVTGVGVRRSTAAALSHAFDLFRFYDSLAAKSAPAKARATTVQRKPVQVDEQTRAVVVTALTQLAGSSADGWVPRVAVKPVVLRLDPTFDEAEHQARTFTEFMCGLQDVCEERRGERDVEYRLRGQGAESGSAVPAQQAVAVDQQAQAQARAAGVRVLRTVLAAAQVSGSPLTLGRLSTNIRSLCPGFDPAGMGFRSFTDFLTANERLLSLEPGVTDARRRVIARPCDPAELLSPAAQDVLRRGLHEVPVVLLAEAAGRDLEEVATLWACVRPLRITLPDDRHRLWTAVRGLTSMVDAATVRANRAELAAALAELVPRSTVDDVQHRTLVSTLAALALRTGPPADDAPAASLAAVARVFAETCVGALRGVRPEPFVTVLAGDDAPPDVRQALLTALRRAEASRTGSAAGEHATDPAAGAV
jgi:hypothetical protein